MVVFYESLEKLSQLAEHDKLSLLCETLYSMGEDIKFVVKCDDKIHQDSCLIHWHNPRLDMTVADKSIVVKRIRGRKVYARKKKYPDAYSGLRLYNELGKLEIMFGVKIEFISKDNCEGLTNEEKETFNTAGDNCSVQTSC